MTFRSRSKTQSVSFSLMMSQKSNRSLTHGGLPMKRIFLKSSHVALVSIVTYNVITLLTIVVQGRLIPRSNCGVDFSFECDANDRHVLLSSSIKSIPSGVAVNCVQASHDPLFW